MQSKLSDNNSKKFQLKHFLQLVRFKNLLLLVFVQILFVAVSSKSIFNIDFIKLVLLIQSTVLLAAAGNVINDFFDVKTDIINKPNKVLVGKIISGKSVLSIYYVLNFFGIISGIVLAYLQNKIIYGLLFIAISITLFYYSKSLKKIALLGNFIVSFFIALSIILIIIFPPFYKLRFQTQNYIELVIYTYSFFAFILNFIREIVKDIEDIDGDNIQNMKTLPILIGRKRTQNIIFYLSFIPFLTVILLVSNTNNILLMIYSIIFVIIPLGYFMYQIKEIKTKKGFNKLSALLKVIMFFGILSVILVK